MDSFLLTIELCEEHIQAGLHGLIVMFFPRGAAVADRVVHTLGLARQLAQEILDVLLLSADLIFRALSLLDGDCAVEHVVSGHLILIETLDDALRIEVFSFTGQAQVAITSDFDFFEVLVEIDSLGNDVIDVLAQIVVTLLTFLDQLGLLARQ